MEKNSLVSEVLTKIWDNRKIIIILIVLFLLAFSIRGHLLRYNYIFEFDSYYHARVVSQIIQYGHPLNPDPYAYYQLPAGGDTPATFTLHWTVAATIYEVLAFGQPFNKDLLFMLVKLLPAIYGALIALAMFWLGKEIFSSKKAGLVVAFIAAVVPAFVYRTMAGFFEDDSLGFLPMIIGLVFFARAMKSDDTMEGFNLKELLANKMGLINAALAGIFFGIMSWTWGMYLLVPLILAAYFCFAAIWVASTKEKKTFLPFVIKFFLTFIIFMAINQPLRPEWLTSLYSFAAGVINVNLTGDIIAIALISFFVAVTVIGFLISRIKTESKTIFASIVVLALYLMILLMGMFFATTSDLSDRTVIGNMVGEESAGNHFFGTKYNSLIIFPVVTLALLPAVLYFMRKKDSHLLLIPLFWIMLTLFMAFYKLKFTYTFGLPIAMAAGFVFMVAMEAMKRFDLGKGIEAKAIAACIFFLLILGVGASSVFVPDYQPYNDEHPEWTEAMNWIKSSTPTDAKLMNWWDQGHILAWITERKVSTDNRNFAFSANKQMAEFNVTEDTNRGYEIASKDVGADYIVLDSSMFSQGPSFAYYMINKVDGSDPQVKKYYEGVITTLRCSDTGDSMNCNGNIFSKEEFNKISATWTSLPTQFYNGKDPLYFYRQGNSIVVLNQAANYSNLAKVWFNSDETKAFYEETFSNGSIKIFKVLK